MKHRYLWGPNVDQLLADEQYGAGTGGASSPSAGVGNTLWALADHLGTIRDIADFDTVANPGVFSIVNHRVFDSFGNLTSQTSTSPSASIAFRYTGKWFDDFTGLSHHWNRWYDPKLGKWISEDPIGFAGGDKNLHRYAGNRVLRYRDSNGLDWIDTISVPADSSPEYGGSVPEFVLPFDTPIEGTDGVFTNPFREPDDLVWMPNMDTQLADLDYDGTGSGNSEGGFGVADGASIGADFIPWVSSGKGGVELITGYDYIANEPVNRWWAAAGILAGIIGAKGWLKAGAKASSGTGGLVYNADEFITLYRGDYSGFTEFRSRAARNTSFAESQRLIDEGDLDELMKRHAARRPKVNTPFISLTDDFSVAEFFATQGGTTVGTVYTIRVPRTRAKFNPFNEFDEREFLVPNRIKGSEIIGEEIVGGIR